MKYICSICGYVYDETSEGTAFTDLPDSWVCPLCRAAKDLFRPEKIEAAPEPARPDPAAAGPSAHVDTDHAGEDRRYAARTLPGMQSSRLEIR